MVQVGHEMNFGIKKKEERRVRGGGSVRQTLYTTASTVNTKNNSLKHYGHERKKGHGTGMTIMVKSNRAF